MFSSLYKKTGLWPYFFIATLTIASTVILWLPFLLKLPSLNDIDTSGISFQTVLAHWDGPLYIIPAKTWYNPLNPILAKSPLGLDLKYFAAHLPGYPATIAVLAPLAGFAKATVLSTIIFSVTLYLFFLYFIKNLKLSTYNPSTTLRASLLLTIVFLFFTPRLFVVRSVGSPEPMFILFILTSIFMFVKKKYFWSGLFGGLAVVTKTPAILLFGAYGLYFLENWRRTHKIDWNYSWLLLIPASLLAVFAFYHRQYGDFFAYFHSGDNLHLLFPPFSVFNFQKNWVATGWLEEVVFIYFFYFLTLITLWEKTKNMTMGGAHGGPPKSANRNDAIFGGNGQQALLPDVRNRFYKISFYFVLLFFISIISVQHRDISRYSLPILPIALITFSDFFTSKKFLIALACLLPAIYLYAFNFMLTNTAPITDWVPFL